MRSLLIAAVLFLALWPIRALAQTEPPLGPAQFDKDARAAFAEERYREAAELFERAQRMGPHPATQFNAALSWDRAGELARAADGYEAALGMAGLRVEMADTARKRLAVLKKSLGYIQITEPIGETVSVAHAKDVSIPVNVHVAPGKQRVVVRRRDGTKIEREVSVLAGEVVSVALTDKPSAARPKAPPVVRRSHESPAPLPDKEPAVRRRTWGFIAIGAGVVAAGAAIASGLKMRSELDKFEDSGRHDLEARDSAVRYKLWANVLAGTAIVAGGAGTYLVLSDSGGSSASSARRGRFRIGFGAGYVDGTLSF
jgi:hypothetical protein